MVNFCHKIILYPSPLAPFFGKEEDLKLRCKLEWPNGIHVSGQDFPSLAGGRAVVIIHYAIIPFV